MGNCASALLQGIEYYRNIAKMAAGAFIPGLMNPDIGGYLPGDIEVVAAFDIDRRKVGRPVEEAIFAAPNCTKKFVPDMPGGGPVVRMAHVLDGMAPHMRDYPEDQTFLPADEPPCDVEAVLRESGAEILVSYLPVGSEEATRFYAEACLDAGVSLVNCIPVFIASDPAWSERFRQRGIPIIGDDIKCAAGGHDRAPGARPPVLRARRPGAADVSAEHRGEHRLPQHAVPAAAPVEEDLEDGGRDVACSRTISRTRTSTSGRRTTSPGKRTTSSAS